MTCGSAIRRSVSFTILLGKAAIPADSSRLLQALQPLQGRRTIFRTDNPKREELDKMSDVWRFPRVGEEECYSHRDEFVSLLRLTEVFWRSLEVARQEHR